MKNKHYNYINSNKFKQYASGVSIYKALINKDSNTVTISDLFGNQEDITRLEFISTYTDLLGKKLKILKLRSDTEYYVLKWEEHSLYALYIPTHLKFKVPTHKGEVTINGLPTSKGSYIVCQDLDGKINRKSVGILDKVVLRGFYKIAPTSKPIFRAKPTPKPKPTHSSTLSSNSTSAYQPSTKPVQSSNLKATYVVTHRVINDNKLVGFEIQEKRTGNFRMVSLVELMKLCLSDDYIVDNVGVRTVNGKRHLYGLKGTHIQELPVSQDYV